MPQKSRLAPLKKSICSLIDLRDVLLGSNQRHLAFLSSLNDHSGAQWALERVTQTRSPWCNSQLDEQEAPLP